MIEPLYLYGPMVAGIVLLLSAILNFFYPRLWWQIVLAPVVYGGGVIWFMGPGPPGDVVFYGLIVFVACSAFGIPLAVFAMPLPELAWRWLRARKGG
ncbi:hypothetical protein [Erythrobacter sp.]|uniref:hypothetical protein n=1 Tax=Erythrobacter sp. TaxID=1042 RepID=UPI002EA8AB15|nr:hypothetical protein [Erythrobacter sp.]